MAIIQTKRDGWSKPLGIVSSNSAALNATTGMKWANVPAASYSPSQDQNSIEIAWAMAADGNICTATLYAARESGDIVTVWTATLTAGTQQATDGGTWVDTIASDTDYWESSSGDGVNKYDYEGGNRIARIGLDTRGYSKFFFIFGGLDEGETITTYFSGV